MTIKHTCGGPVFGRTQAGCPRCDQLLDGSAPVRWSNAGARKRRAERVEAIRAHDCKASRCGPVCTAFEL